MIVVGIDPSLTGTGVAVYNSVGIPNQWRTTTIKRVPMPGAEAGTVLSFRHIIEAVADTITAAVKDSDADSYYPVDMVVIEGPAFSKNNGMAHERAGLWWYIYGHLTAFGCPIVVVKPNVRAKYATGRGNAGKDEVMLSAARRYPTASIDNNNESDAVVLAAMGARLLGVPMEPSLPVAHLAAMKTLSLSK